jgi:hypothetical protein
MSLAVLVATMILQPEPLPAVAAKPKTPAVEAFASLCSGTRDADEPAARAIAASWSERKPEQGTEFALLVNSEPPELRGRTFASGHRGYSVHLWTRLTQPVRFAECRILVFDVSDPEPIMADVIGWRGRAPDLVVNAGPGDWGRSVGWRGAKGEVITASVERLPCPTDRSCRKSRIVIERSLDLGD